MIRLLLILLLCSSSAAWAGTAYIDETTDSEALAADATVATGAIKLSGWSVRESAGSAAVATVVLRNASDTDSGTAGAQCAESGGDTQVGGAAVAYIELAANESQQHIYEPGISLPSGLCADVLAGTVDIQVYFTGD